MYSVKAKKNCLHFQSEINFHLQTPCEETENYREDDCLWECIRDQFVSVANCIHPRIKIKFPGDEAFPVCKVNDLENLVSRNILPQRTFEVQEEEKAKEIDPGKLDISLLFIKDYWTIQYILQICF